MDDAKFTQEGRAVYETFCNALTADDWKFNRHDEDLVITCGAKGDDLPMEFVIRVDCQRSIVSVLSRLPVTFDEDKRVDGSLAICVANHGMVHGSFDFNQGNGEVYFRLVNSFHGSKLSPSLCIYMILCACHTIDNYNDKLLMLSKGLISLEQFIKSENG